jgi:DNA-binding response OmpR family regulator
VRERLHDHPGSAARLWVDTVIRTLRKKLASERERIQTVAKAGYRYVR